MDKLDDLLDLADPADLIQHDRQPNITIFFFQNAWDWVLTMLMAVHDCSSLQLIRHVAESNLGQHYQYAAP
jgi:hypothetical protein